MNFMKQTGPQDVSPIQGKLMNCREFGTYMPLEDPNPARRLCHGGTYFGDEYLPCPVREECKSALMASKIKNQQARFAAAAKLQQLPSQQLQRSQPTTQPSTTARMFTPEMFQLPTLRAPQYGARTTLPQAKPTEQTHAATTGTSEQAAAAQAAYVPPVIHPPADALPGMRTPFASSHDFVGTSPTFLPKEGENFWDRLIKNVVQGVIATIGWHVYSLLRVVDLFD